MRVLITKQVEEYFFHEGIRAIVAHDVDHFGQHEGAGGSHIWTHVFGQVDKDRKNTFAEDFVTFILELLVLN